MIMIKTKKFAETNQEMISSLFTRGGTCVGYAKRRKRDVVLYDIKRNPVGFINCHGVIGSASVSEGKTWFGYGDIVLVGPLSLIEKDEICGRVCVDKDVNGFVFK
jgi:hypothetical protein